MKPTIHQSNPRCGSPSRQRDGFTLAELLIAITVFILLLSGILSAHLFGLSMYRITETKLNATSDARQVIGKMANEIRTCSSAEVGDIKDITVKTVVFGVTNLVTTKGFAGFLDGDKQQGSSLMIYPSTNKTRFINYFINPSDKTFRRTTSDLGSATIIAERVTNRMAFSAQNHLGQILTKNLNNRVIHLSLEFYQSPRYMQVADYYKLETAVTRRALE